MDFDGNNRKLNEMWESGGEEYNLQRDSLNDISHCLWDEANQNVDDLFYMLEEQTPTKDCAYPSYQVSDIGEINSKELEECREASQFKRRRVLHFTSESYEVTKFSTMEGLSESLQWNSEWSLGFSDDNCALNYDGLDQSSEGWLVDCLNENKTHCSSEEMNNPSSMDQIDVSEFCNIPSEVEAVVVQKTPAPACFRVSKGRKSFNEAPTKLTSVAYPFDLIKPCGVHGDVTLKDINQRIHAPSESKVRHKKDEESVPYPPSAFSGKPVVVKTRIHTKGRKGNITIMRTRG
ncbi:protein XRI1-like isoform X2 [Typha latifolia]|uniref:protein XRI1-like isoform X1 n=2 Tax=Typha latifolia TaxID=4733 RepID=UPI003C306F99